LSELSAEGIKRGLKTDLIGQSVVYYPSLGSTNEVLKELAAQGAPEGTLVIADEQTAGKGRLGRKWLAPPGTSLLMSLLFRPDPSGRASGRSLAPNQAPRLTMICSLAIADAIEGLTGLSVGLKWPNDIFIRGKKAGGILTESGTTGGHLDYVIVGMGLNVNLAISALPELRGLATSLSEELGREVSRLELLWRILEGIETRYVSLSRGESPHEEWTARLINLGHQVQVTTSQGVLAGWAEGVDADGALILRTRNGQRKRILAGDVTLRSPPDDEVVGLQHSAPSNGA
jgi:BirA family biotin operon repressor/biotin-[acetyl-CoA-carboxylase] ligase